MSTSQTPFYPVTHDDAVEMSTWLSRINNNIAAGGLGGGGSASIDDTAGAGDTDMTWSANKFVSMAGPVSVFLTQMAQLIPNLAFTSSNNNAAATISAAQSAAVALNNGQQVIHYSITKSLTNCSLSNTTSNVIAGNSYTSTIVLGENYDLDIVTITMGGTDITSTAWDSSTNTIAIAEVTSNIVITAIASTDVVSVAAISATFSQGSAKVYPTDALDTLKQYLVVTALYDDNTSAVVAAANYTLSGTLTQGTSVITVSYSGKTTTFTVNVSAPVTLSSISAALNLNGHVVHADDSLDSLKTYLIVTATYSDSHTSAVAAESYTLSGTLTEGTSTITVTYSGKTTTFTVSVSAPVVLSSISAVIDLNGNTVHSNDSLDSLKQYLTVTAIYSDSSTAPVAAASYTLSGTLAEGTSTVTVSYSGKTTTFTVTVAGAAVPSGYTALQYVSTGSGQYIDTGILASDIDHARYDVSYDSVPTKGGRVLSAGSTYFPFFKTGATGTKQISGNYWSNETLAEGESNAFEWSLDTRYVIEGFMPEVKVNGATIYTMPKGNSAGTGNAFIGIYHGQPTSSQYWFNGKIYSVQIYGTSNTLLADFRPVTNSNNVAGLYDLVSDTFFPSISGTDYVAGPTASAQPTLSYITAELNLNGDIIRENNTLNDLKSYLIVTATYSDSSTSTVPSNDYSLSGSIALASGEYDCSDQTITVTYSGKSATFNVTVYNAMTADYVTLPSGYTQLAMIYSTSTSNGPYINTGIYSYDIDHVKYGIQLSVEPGNNRNLHVLSNNRTYYPYFRKGSSGAKNFQAKNNTSGSTATELNAIWDINTNYEIEAYPTVKINGTTITTVADGGATGGTRLYMFAQSSGDPETVYNISPLRFFYLKMFDSQDQIIHQFIPCKNDSDVAGMYDTVTSTFYSSANESTFSAGAAMVSESSVTLSSISAILNLNGDIIRENNTLNDLKSYLTVTGHYDNGTDSAIAANDYTLSGSLALDAEEYDASTSTITVTYDNKTTTFTVTVHNAMTANPVALPTGYTQLVMIKSTGGSADRAYIDTGVKGLTVDHAEYGVQVHGSYSNGSNIHVLSSNLTHYPYFRVGSAGAMNPQCKYLSTGNATGLSVTWDYNTNYVMKGYPDVEINGTVVTTMTSGGATSPDTNIFIFARCTSGGSASDLGRLRVYYVKLFNSQNELIHYYIPCTNSSDVAGMYDTVTETFYGSSNANVFTAGAVV